MKKNITYGLERLKDDRDKLIKKTKAVHWAGPSMGYTIDAEDYFRLFLAGRYLLEGEGHFIIATSSYREIIPLNFHVPHGMRKFLAQDIYTFTTNQQFAAVAEECSKPRKGDDPDGLWIRHRTRAILGQLHAAGKAVSLEVYGDGLDGGIIGLLIGGVFVSLSVFSRRSGAGNAALLAMQAILCERRFKLHDAIAPSSISRHFGGHLVSAQTYHTLSAEAAGMKVDFPTIDTPLSVADYIQPLMRDRNHGRTFPRQERHASEEQDGSQARQNIRQIGARNHGGGQNGPA
ncbi:MAG: hypothetical protein P4M15_09905 [Alphaproteobacteria bacterium]|nr:hypothetical protein [Alphaproteobacteria bacterium]